MKVALTVWDGRISPVFDVCREALVLEVAAGEVVSTAALDLDPLDPIGKTEEMAELGVEIVICGAVSRMLQATAAARGLEIIGFVAGDVDEVIAAFLRGALPSAAYAMPGCCEGQAGRRGLRAVSCGEVDDPRQAMRGSGRATPGSEGT